MGIYVNNIILTVVAEGNAVDLSEWLEDAHGKVKWWVLSLGKVVTILFNEFPV